MHKVAIISAGLIVYLKVTQGFKFQNILKLNNKVQHLDNNTFEN